MSEIKYNKNQLNLAEHFMCTGHERSETLKKEEKPKEKDTSTPKK